MDRFEEIARRHLLYRGFKSVLYEPDGNVPPDFLVDDRIAVEVRRLNQNEVNTSSPRGLEEVEIPLMSGLQSLLATYGPASKNAWWVQFRFKRPIPRWAKLKGRVKSFLDGVVSTGPLEDQRVQLGPDTELRVLRRTDSTGPVFDLAVWSDWDSGGWVLEEVKRNLRICVREKSTKTARFRIKYPEWWLLLIDTISYGRHEDGGTPAQLLAGFAHDWARIVVVSPLDPTVHYDI